MVAYNGNDAYFSFDGTQIDTYWVDALDYEESVDTEEVTAGSGSTHKQYAAKLTDVSLTFNVAYDVTNLATYKALLTAGHTGTVVYGPEGNATGKPKFECAMLLTNVSTGQNINKDKVMFQLQFVPTAEPTAELYTDTF